MSLPVEGATVRLRDVGPDDADLLDAWAADKDVRGTFNDFGLPPKQGHADALASGPLRNERNGELMIERLSDGRPIGTVGWHRVGYGPNDASGAWNIGIALIPDARGQGLGTEAQRLVAAYLFATTAYDRVEASTDVENLAEQRSLEKAGFVREGILRGAQARPDGRHDLVGYSKLRSDPA